MLILKYYKTPDNCTSCMNKRKLYFKTVIENIDDRHVIIKLMEECPESQVVEIARFINEILTIQYEKNFILKVVNIDGVEIE